jgi:hypothetical protein
MEFDQLLLRPRYVVWTEQASDRNRELDTRAGIGRKQFLPHGDTKCPPEHPKLLVHRGWLQQIELFET